MQAFDSVRSALSGFLQEKGLEWPAKAVVEAAKDPKHGDVATNLAMLLAKPLHRAPRDIAAGTGRVDQGSHGRRGKR